MNDGPPLVLAPELRAAYAATEYVVGGRALRLGAASPSLVEVVGEGWVRLAVVTACNPFSEALSSEENSRRSSELAAWIAGAGLVAVPSLNVDPSGAWPDEPGVAVVFGPLASGWGEVVDDLLLTFAQHAAVVVERWGTVELRRHPDADERRAIEPWAAAASALRCVARLLGRAAAADAVRHAFAEDAVWIDAGRATGAEVRGRDAVLRALSVLEVEAPQVELEGGTPVLALSANARLTTRLTGGTIQALHHQSTAS